jgi:hypothetical protein
MKTRFALACAAAALLSQTALADWQVGPWVTGAVCVD